MEETHQKKIEDLQRQHQRELEKLREEKDRLLAEETAATISGRVKSRSTGVLCLGQTYSSEENWPSLVFS